MQIFKGTASPLSEKGQCLVIPVNYPELRDLFVLEFHGSMATESVLNLEEMLPRLLQGRKHVAFDLSGVRWICSKMISVILSTRRTQYAKDDKFWICGLQPVPRESLDLVEVLDILDVQPSADELARSLLEQGKSG